MDGTVRFSKARVHEESKPPREVILVRSVSSLWIGNPLSVYEEVSLRSFVEEGFDVQLFTYADNLRVPEGVVVRDAREVLDAEKVFENPHQRGTWAGFSNIFRYELVSAVDTVWIDTDVVALRSDIQSNQGYVFGWESNDFINGAILGVPSKSVLSSALVEQAAAIDVESFQWGELGPRLITRLVKQLDLEPLVQPRNAFYPIEFHNVWMLFDPASRETVTEKLSKAQALHWWNEALRLAPLPVKQFLPPELSYFGALMDSFGIEPAGMARLNENWAREKWKPSIEAVPSLWTRATARLKRILRLERLGLT